MLEERSDPPAPILSRVTEDRVYASQGAGKVVEFDFDLACEFMGKLAEFILEKEREVRKDGITRNNT